MREEKWLLKKNWLLGKGGAEEGEHAVAGDVAEGGEFEGIVAAGEFEGAGIGTVGVEGVEHLFGEFGEEGGIVLAVDHERVAAGAHTALDVRHGADGGPEFAKFVEGDVLAEAFPDVIGGHALADYIGEVGGDMKEAASVDAGIVNQSDVADRGADAGAEDADALVALLFEPAQAAAGVLNGLAIGLEGEADVGADELVCALMAASHTAVVVGHAHFQSGDAEALYPFAEAALTVPFGVPVGKNEDGGALLGGGIKLGMDSVVFRPAGEDGAGEAEDVIGVERII